MAKSSNSKVIFLPGSSNSGLQSQLAHAEASGEGPSRYGHGAITGYGGTDNSTGGRIMTGNGGNDNGYGYEITGMASAVNARSIENI